MEILPSLLAADLLNLEQQISTLIQHGIKTIHLDIMDNHYVPNLSFSPDLCMAIRKRFPELLIDVHLMTNPAEQLIQDFAKAGANRIAIHPQTTTHLDYSLQLIKKLNCKAGLVLNPAENFDCLKWTEHLLDYILIMTVNPGFGGQKLLPHVIDKVKELHQFYPKLLIAVDGGVDLNNIPLLKNAGCKDFIVGSALFKASNFPNCINEFMSIVKGI